MTRNTKKMINRLYNDDGVLMLCRVTKDDIEYLEERANKLHEMLERLMNLKTKYWKKRAEMLFLKISDEWHDVRSILKSIPSEVMEDEL